MSKITKKYNILGPLRSTIEKSQSKLRYEAKPGCFTKNGDFNPKVVPSFGAARFVKAKVGFADATTISITGRAEAVGWRVLDSMPVHRFNVTIHFVCSIVKGRVRVAGLVTQVEHIGQALVVDIVGKALAQSNLTTVAKGIAEYLTSQVDLFISATQGIIAITDIRFAGQSMTIEAEVGPPSG